MIIGLDSGVHNSEQNIPAKKKYNKEVYKLWYEKNKEKKIKYAKSYYKENREAKIEWSKEYRKRKPEVTLKTTLKRNYGITIDQYNELLKLQNNKCKLCGLTFESTTKKNTPHVDHCHNTGIVRGILCHQCNLNLGIIENKDFLQKALTYLKKTK